jgi:hypothetical protein
MLAKFSSASTMSATPLETSVPVTPHRDTYVGGSERRRIVNPITGHSNDMPMTAEDIDYTQFVFRIDPSEHCVRSRSPHRAFSRSCGGILIR